MLTCREASRLLSQSMDRPLPFMQRIELRVHVWICAACTHFEKQLIFLRQAVRYRDEKIRDTDEPGLSPEARERIRNKLRG